MAVYTHVPAEALGALLERYDIGAATAFKGIAEGVENSNYLLETPAGRFILTLYEKRVAEEDLPFFFGLTTHLAQRGLPVPRPVADRNGTLLQRLCARPAAIVEFLPGVSVSRPTPAHARAAGAALARLHLMSADFAMTRPNALGPAGWRSLAERMGQAADQVTPGLAAAIADELDELIRRWPDRLPVGAIHADLFPDNVLFLGERVSGLIDFYFAATDAYAYDLAVMHVAWGFDPATDQPLPDIAAALLEGYERERPLIPRERAALPLLARGAALRFLLTRAWDWLNTPPGALVARKDPLAFWRRLRALQSPA